jgi:hypothetical protein
MATWSPSRSAASVAIVAVLGCSANQSSATPTGATAEITAASADPVVNNTSPIFLDETTSSISDLEPVLTQAPRLEVFGEMPNGITAADIDAFAAAHPEYATLALPVVDGPASLTGYITWSEVPSLVVKSGTETTTWTLEIGLARAVGCDGGLVQQVRSDPAGCVAGIQHIWTEQGVTVNLSVVDPSAASQLLGELLLIPLTTG